MKKPSICGKHFSLSRIWLWVSVRRRTISQPWTTWRWCGSQIAAHWVTTLPILLPQKSQTKDLRLTSRPFVKSFGGCPQSWLETLPTQTLWNLAERRFALGLQPQLWWQMDWPNIWSARNWNCWWRLGTWRWSMKHEWIHTQKSYRGVRFSFISCCTGHGIHATCFSQLGIRPSIRWLKSTRVKRAHCLRCCQFQICDILAYCCRKGWESLRIMINHFKIRTTSKQIGSFRWRRIQRILVCLVKRSSEIMIFLLAHICSIACKLSESFLK